MKGVILAGGYGTRLGALTSSTLNKHLVAVGDRPMIFHVIENLVASGIEDILILLNGHNAGLVLEMLEDGSKFGCHINYRYAKEVNGPGRTLLLARQWVGREPFLTILGDSLFFQSLPWKKKQVPHMFVVPMTPEFDELSKYGQVTLKNGKVSSIIWKPREPVSSLVQATAFILHPEAFERLDILDKTVTGEVSITMLTTQYVQEGMMHYTLLPENSFIDCGTMQALQTATRKFFP